MLLTALTPVPLPILILVINLPFIALGYRQIGRAFAIRSALAIVGLAVAPSLIPSGRTSRRQAADVRRRRVLRIGAQDQWR